MPGLELNGMWVTACGAANPGRSRLSVGHSDPAGGSGRRLAGWSISRRTRLASQCISWPPLSPPWDRSESSRLALLDSLGRPAARRDRPHAAHDLRRDPAERLLGRARRHGRFDDRQPRPVPARTRRWTAMGQSSGTRPGAALPCVVPPIWAGKTVFVPAVVPFCSASAQGIRCVSRNLFHVLRSHASPWQSPPRACCDTSARRFSGCI